MRAALLGLLLLGCCGPALGTTPDAFYTTGISLNDVTKAVTGGRNLAFDNSQPSADGTYQLKLQLLNAGSKTVAVQSLQTSIYTGTYSSSIPSGATPILTVPVQGKLPSLQPGQSWPSGGAPLAIPVSALPPATPCEPWNLTLAVDSTFTFVGGTSVSQTSQREVLPVSIEAKCAEPMAATRSAPLQVKITTPEHYSQTDKTQIPVLVDFGERLIEQDPLQLFNVEGSSRVDVVYAVDKGRLYLMAYVNSPDDSRPITISVAPNVAANAAGVSNAGASLQVYYEPQSGGWRAASCAMSAVLAGATSASWGTSFLSSCLRPTTTAGSLGYGMLGYLLWAQKFFLTGLLGTPKLPVVYRTAADAFRWTSFHNKRPWVQGSVSLNDADAFQESAMLEVDGSGNLLAYDGNGSVTMYVPPPSPTMDSMVQPAPDARDFQTPPHLEGGNATSTWSQAASPSPAARPSPSPQQQLPNPSSPPATASETPASLSEPSPEPNPSPRLGTPPSPVTHTPSPVPAPTPNDLLGIINANSSIASSSPSLKPAASPPLSSQPGNISSINGLGAGIPSQSILDRLLGGKKRLLSVQEEKEGRRALLQQDPQWSAISGNTRYVLASIVPSSPTAAPTSYLTGQDAWTHASAIINQASPYVDKYSILLDITFWAGGFFLVACLINLAGWLVIRCCRTELPGVLHAPRMQLVCLMLVLMVLGEAGSHLFDDGLAPLFVGLAVLTCFPLTFLLLAYLACTGPLCRKEKAVYLLSRRSRKESEGGNSVQKLLLCCFGIPPYRGKWKTADPGRRNSFVFHWGPIFEDCRGPPYANRQMTTPSRPSLLQSASLTNEVSARLDKRDSSKALAMVDPPVTICCCLSLRRSLFQVHGILVSLARLVAYGVVIGALGAQPLLQAALLAGLSVLYVAYLRLVVPYSRPGEMAVEYWAALLDVGVFGMATVLSALPSTPNPCLNSIGLAMLVLQCAAYAAYLLNRAITVVGAWSEVVWPVCCRPGHLNSRSGTQEMSSQKLGSYLDLGDLGPVLAIQASACDSEDKLATKANDALHEESSSRPSDVQPNGFAFQPPPPVRILARTNSDNTSFPAIQEETESQLNTPLDAFSPTYTQLSPPVISPASFKPAGTPRLAEVKVQANETPRRHPSHDSQQSVEGHPPTASNLRSRPEGTDRWQEDSGGRTAVWDRFWRYL